MKVKCDYCGQMVDENEKTCPNCGGPMPVSNRVAGSQPKTIEELKKWYNDHHLPPEETTRFFIGKDIKEPKAFGIYKDGAGDFIVYKNKADGERVVRYQGKDEGYAVNELYQRLKSEIADQKANNGKGKNKGGKKNEKSGPLDWIIAFFVLPFVSPFFAGIYIIIGLVIFALFDHSPSRGYYNYKGNDYYYQDSSWYYYDASSDAWSVAPNADELDSVINDDTYNDYMTDDHSGMRFEESSWYDSGTSDDSFDWDSDSDWESSDWDSGGSWDSGSSDWDSDW